MSSKTPLKPKRTATWQDHCRGVVVAIRKWALTSRWARLGLLWLLAWMVLTAFFCADLLRDSNYLNVFPSDMVVPLVLNALSAAIVAAVVGLLPVPRSVSGKVVAALFLAGCLVDYDARLSSIEGIYRAMLPFLPNAGGDVPIISLLFLLSLIALAVAIGVLVDKAGQRYHHATTMNVVGVSSIIAGFLLVSQAVPTIGVMLPTAHEAAYVPTQELKDAAGMRPTVDANKPDIYYLVLEDYASNAILKSQFGYDNGAFMTWLRDQGFSVDENAHAQYPTTATSMAASMNLSYLNDDVRAYKSQDVQSATLFFNMVRHAQAVALLKQQGYQYYQLGNDYGAFDKAPQANLDNSWMGLLTVFGHEKRLRGMEAIYFDKSPYYRFAQIGAQWWPVHLTEIDHLSLIRRQLAQLHDYATAPSQGGRFIFANILAPHWPAYMNADCSLAAEIDDNDTGRLAKQKYTDEMQCINQQIQSVIAEITEHSNGQAIILLVSDEGQYPTHVNGTFLNPVSEAEGVEDVLGSKMPDWSAADLQMKYGILQAVRIPRATEQDLQAVAPVNLFRIILDRYFGYSYPYLPNCQMAIAGYWQDWYNFKDVTKQVTGAENPACRQYQE